MIVGLTGDTLEVVYVQEKPAPKCTTPLAVAMASPFGLMFPLTKDSYFTGYQVIRTKMVTEVCREHGSPSKPLHCPWSKYPAIEAIATERKRQIVQRQEVLAKAKAYRAACPVSHVPPGSEPPLSAPPSANAADTGDNDDST